MSYLNDYQPPARQQSPAQPQASYQQPAPQQPQGYNQPPQTEQPTQQPPTNSATFTADTKVLEYITMVHPEMASAMINIAIKKFAETEDFWDYFVKDEFQKIAQKEQLLKESKTDISEKSKPEEEVATTSSIDFTSW
jgi:hypothetical protein